MISQLTEHGSVYIIYLSFIWLFALLLAVFRLIAKISNRDHFSLEIKGLGLTLSLEANPSNSEETSTSRRRKKDEMVS